MTTYPSDFIDGGAFAPSDINAMIDDIQALEAGNAALTPYSPTITGITVGTGIVTAKYRVVNKRVEIKGRIAFAGDTSITSAPTISLPVVPADAIEIDSHGTAHFYDASGSRHYGRLYYKSGPAIGFLAGYAAGTYVSGELLWSPGPVLAPFTWAAGDRLEWFATYEAA